MQLSALCADPQLAPGDAGGSLAGWPAAGGGGSGELQGQGSEQHLSPRAALAAAAAAAAARGAAAGGLDWMQALLPRLRELEGWLFGEMVKHLWWRVLLHSVTAAARRAASGKSSGGGGGAGSSAASGGGGGGGGGGGAGHGVLRLGRSAPHLAAEVSAGSEAASPASLQGTPRSFETPEVCGEEKGGVGQGGSGVEWAARAARAGQGREGRGGAWCDERSAARLPHTPRC